MLSGLLIAAIIFLPFALLAKVYISSFNALGMGHAKVEEGWAGIEVQLRRRHDLVPALAGIVRDAISHESAMVEQITTAREEAIKALASPDRDQIAIAEHNLSDALHSLFSYSEDNPELHATQNMERLQRQIEETEDQIAASRRIFNGNVSALNGRLLSFPGNFIGQIHGYKQAQPFALSQIERTKMMDMPSISLIHPAQKNQSKS